MIIPNNRNNRNDYTSSTYMTEPGTCIEDTHVNSHQVLLADFDLRNNRKRKRS